MTIVAVLGATGFVGSHVVTALERRGVTVRRVPAPRLSASARSGADLQAAAENEPAIALLRTLFTDCSVVVNAAGLANATSGLDDALVGANALLPAVVARALPSGCRLVHVSSAAVQGRVRQLDESRLRQSFSPYSWSKAWGEEMLEGQPCVVIFRPTSIQGAGRDVTRRLVRIVSSPFASVAGTGARPTPQALVANVADAIAFVALAEEPPAIVLQPWEGLTTRDLVRRLGNRNPIGVPVFLARAIVAGATAAGRVLPKAAGLARRLEMLWLGQAQTITWLESSGWTRIDDDWEALR